MKRRSGANPVLWRLAFALLRIPVGRRLKSATSKAISSSSERPCRLSGRRLGNYRTAATRWLVWPMSSSRAPSLSCGCSRSCSSGYADRRLEEREFFIRKAIGWVLREVSKKRPDLVFEWLEPRAARASGVTTREAVKYLSPSQRHAILERKSKPKNAPATSEKE